jgi:cob(I)alamin adenosyltransferase
MVSAGLAHNHPHALEAVNRLSDVLFVMARNADGRDTLSRRVRSTPDDPAPCSKAIIRKLY